MSSFYKYFKVEEFCTATHTVLFASSPIDATRLAALLIQESRWFKCEPYPFEHFMFTLKNEAGIEEMLSEFSSKVEVVKSNDDSSLELSRAIEKMSPDNFANYLA